MTGIKIKPVPGYGDVLSDLNQVPVLTLADRVRQDIVLPVLDRRSDSVLDRSKAKFLRSANGSALVNRDLRTGLQLLQEMDINIEEGSDETVEFDNPGEWIGFDFYNENNPDMQLDVKSLLGPSLFSLALDDPVFWLHTPNIHFLLVASGLGFAIIDVRLFQFG